MKRFVMVVVGLILTLTSLAGSEDINFQPFKSDKQIAVDQIEWQLGQISGGPNGFGSDNESGAMFNTNNYNFLDEKVNQNLEDIINSIPNRFDANITSDKDFQMEISKSFDQVIPGSISDRTPIDSNPDQINETKYEFVFLVNKNGYEIGQLISNNSLDISSLIGFPITLNTACIKGSKSRKLNRNRSLAPWATIVNCLRLKRTKYDNWINQLVNQ